MSNKEKLFEIIAGVFKIEKEVVCDETSPENTPNWDSFNTLKLITEIEDAFDVFFELDEIAKIKSVKDIREALMKCDIDVR